MKYLMAKKIFSTALSGFYSRVETIGLESIPKNRPVLFIANHSNAFVDPLLLASNLERPVTFTAKSTLAKNPLLNLIIKSFSVELLSRRIDRKEYDTGRLANVNALERLEMKLHNKGAVYIFPEGKSHNDAHLHEFKTGAAKLALSYMQNCNSVDDDSDLLVVPLGLIYSDKSMFRSTATIQLGEPLSLRAWCAVHPHANANTLTQQFKSMVEGALATQKHVARQAALSVKAPVHKSSLSSRFVRWEKALIGTPLGALGWLLNALPFALTAVMVRLLSSDHDHPASAAIVTGPPIFTLVHALQLLSVGLYGSGFLMMLYLLILIPSTVFSLKVFDRLFKSRSNAVGLQQFNV